MMAPNTCEALVIREIDDKSTHVKQQIPTPEPATNQVLVKVSHVAQNPTDGAPFAAARVSNMLTGE